MSQKNILPLRQAGSRDSQLSAEKFKVFIPKQANYRFDLVLRSEMLLLARRFRLSGGEGREAEPSRRARNGLGILSLYQPPPLGWFLVLAI